MANLTRATIYTLAAVLFGLAATTMPGLVGNASAEDEQPVNQVEIVETLKWRAWVDAMPGPNKRSRPLYVKGEVVLPLPGYKIVMAPPKRANLRAPNLILDLTITKERAPGAQVLTSYAPFYVNKTPPRRYTSIEIRYNGKTLHTIRQINVIQ